LVVIQNITNPFNEKKNIMRKIFLLVVGISFLQIHLPAQDLINQKVDSTLLQLSSWTTLSPEQKVQLSQAYSEFYIAEDSIQKIDGIYTDEILIRLQTSLDQRISSILTTEQIQEVKLGLEEIKIQQKVDELFEENFSSIPFEGDEEAIVRMLMFQREKERLAISLDNQLTIAEQEDRIQFVDKVYSDSIAKINQHVRLRERSKSRVSEIQSNIDLTDNQVIQLTTLFLEYFHEFSKYYRDPNIREIWKEYNTVLHDKIQAVLTES